MKLVLVENQPQFVSRWRGPWLAKHCSNCGRLVPPAGFAPNRARPDGVQQFCRECDTNSVKVAWMFLKGAKSYGTPEWWWSKLRCQRRMITKECSEKLNLWEWCHISGYHYQVLKDQYGYRNTTESTLDLQFSTFRPPIDPYVEWLWVRGKDASHIMEATGIYMPQLQETIRWLKKGVIAGEVKYWSRAPLIRHLSHNEYTLRRQKYATVGHDAIIG